LGHEVICIDSRDTGSLQNIEPIAHHDDFLLVNHDLAQTLFGPMTMTYHRQQGVDTCVARIFGTYGQRVRPQDGRAPTTFMHRGLGAKPLTVFGDGSQTRSFCHVADLVRGLVLLAESGEHSPVNLGSPAPVMLRGLAKPSSA
jgi:dTDP-glucose 4,6-dehydratase